MKRHNLTLERIGVEQITGNHQCIKLFDFELNISYGKIFAVTFIVGEKRNTFCRQMTRLEKSRSGHHFNLVEPNHKKRLVPTEWKKLMNGKIFNHIHFDLPAWNESVEVKL